MGLPPSESICCNYRFLQPRVGQMTSRIFRRQLELTQALRVLRVAEQRVPALRPALGWGPLV